MITPICILRRHINSIRLIKPLEKMETGLKRKSKRQAAHTQNILILPPKLFTASLLEVPLKYRFISQHQRTQKLRTVIMRFLKVLEYFVVLWFLNISFLTLQVTNFAASRSNVYVLHAVLSLTSDSFSSQHQAAPLCWMVVFKKDLRIVA